jgi:hypothetical protein
MLGQYYPLRENASRIPTEGIAGTRKLRLRHTARLNGLCGFAVIDLHSED